MNLALKTADFVLQLMDFAQVWVSDDAAGEVPEEVEAEEGWEEEEEDIFDQFNEDDVGERGGGEGVMEEDGSGNGSIFDGVMDEKNQDSSDGEGAVATLK